MRIQYDKRTDTIYITVEDGIAERGFEVQRTCVLRCNEQGDKVYGLTILDALEPPAKQPATA